MTIHNLQKYLESNIPGACVPVDLIKISENVSGHRGYISSIPPRPHRGGFPQHRGFGGRRGSAFPPLPPVGPRVPRGHPSQRRNGQFVHIRPGIGRGSVVRERSYSEDFDRPFHAHGDDPSFGYSCFRPSAPHPDNEPSLDYFARGQSKSTSDENPEAFSQAKCGISQDQPYADSTEEEEGGTWMHGRKLSADYTNAPSEQPFSLVLDAEGCLDRLYGGYYSDWVCGGQWNRMLEYLTSLITTARSHHLRLTVFFNGALEKQKMDQWINNQIRNRSNINSVISHIVIQGSPPPKIWWLPPTCLQTCLRLALRHLGVDMGVSVDDHHQEVIGFCREHSYDGVIGNDSDYLVFDPPRYFSSQHLKLTYKGALETVEFLLTEVCTGLSIPRERLSLIAALLPNFLLSEQELQSFYFTLLGSNEDIASPAGQEKVILALCNFASLRCRDMNNLPAICHQVFGNSNDGRVQKLCASIQYFLNGTQEGFLQYQQPGSSHKSSIKMDFKSDKFANIEQVKEESVGDSRQAAPVCLYGPKMRTRRHNSVPLLSNIPIISETPEDNADQYDLVDEMVPDVKTEEIRRRYSASSGEETKSLHKFGKRLLNKRLTCPAIRLNDGDIREDVSYSGVSIHVPKIVIEVSEPSDTKVQCSHLTDESDDLSGSISARKFRIPSIDITSVAEEENDDTDVEGDLEEEEDSPPIHSKEVPDSDVKVSDSKATSPTENKCMHVFPPTKEVLSCSNCCRRSASPLPLEGIPENETLGDSDEEKKEPMVLQRRRKTAGDASFKNLTLSDQSSVYGRKPSIDDISPTDPDAPGLPPPSDYTQSLCSAAKLSVPLYCCNSAASSRKSSDASMCSSRRTSASSAAPELMSFEVAPPERDEHGCLIYYGSNASSRRTSAASVCGGLSSPIYPEGSPSVSRRVSSSSSCCGEGCLPPECDSGVMCGCCLSTASGSPGASLLLSSSSSSSNSSATSPYRLTPDVSWLSQHCRSNSPDSGNSETSDTLAGYSLSVHTRHASSSASPTSPSPPSNFPSSKQPSPSVSPTLRRHSMEGGDAPSSPIPTYSTPPSPQPAIKEEEEGEEMLPLDGEDMPLIAHEVMRTASERHQKGLMHPWIYQLLAQREIKLAPFLEQEIASGYASFADFYRPLRQNVYAVLFNVHHFSYAKKKAKMEKESFDSPEKASRKDSGGDSSESKSDNTSSGKSSHDSDSPPLEPNPTKTTTTPTGIDESSVRPKVLRPKVDETDDTLVKVKIREWVYSPQNVYQVPIVVHSVPLNWPVPTVNRLWFGCSKDDAKRRIRAYVSCLRSDTPLMLQPAYVPQRLLILATVLRYLVSSGGDSVLTRQELDAFIVTAFSDSLGQYLQDLPVGQLSPRAVQLASLFMAGVECAIFANEACGGPVAWWHLGPWQYFDGKLFHSILKKAYICNSLSELCGQDVELLSRAENCRKAILENLDVTFPKVFANDFPHPLHPLHPPPSKDSPPPSSSPQSGSQSSSQSPSTLPPGDTPFHIAQADWMTKRIFHKFMRLQKKNRQVATIPSVVDVKTNFPSKDFCATNDQNSEICEILPKETPIKKCKIRKGKFRNKNHKRMETIPEEDITVPVTECGDNNCRLSLKQIPIDKMFNLTEKEEEELKKCVSNQSNPPQSDHEVASSTAKSAKKKRKNKSKNKRKQKIESKDSDVLKSAQHMIALDNNPGAAFDNQPIIDENNNVPRDFKRTNLSPEVETDEVGEEKELAQNCEDESTLAFHQSEKMVKIYQRKVMRKVVEIPAKFKKQKAKRTTNVQRETLIEIKPKDEENSMENRNGETKVIAAKPKKKKKSKSKCKVSNGNAVNCEPYSSNRSESYSGDRNDTTHYRTFNSFNSHYHLDGFGPHSHNNGRYVEHQRNCTSCKRLPCTCNRNAFSFRANNYRYSPHASKVYQNNPPIYPGGDYRRFTGDTTMAICGEIASCGDNNSYGDFNHDYPEINHSDDYRKFNHAGNFRKFNHAGYFRKFNLEGNYHKFNLEGNYHKFNQTGNYDRFRHAGSFHEFDRTEISQKFNPRENYHKFNLAEYDYNLNRAENYQNFNHDDYSSNSLISNKCLWFPPRNSFNSGKQRNRKSQIDLNILSRDFHGYDIQKHPPISTPSIGRGKNIPHSKRGKSRSLHNVSLEYHSDDEESEELLTKGRKRLPLPGTKSTQQ